VSRARQEGREPRISYPYGRLVRDRLWCLPDYAELVDPKGNVREQLARQRDAPAGFAPDVLATFEHAPELIDVAAVHLLDQHFAPGLHEEILEAVGLELGAPVATRRRDASFRAAVLEAYIAECCVCGFSFRLVDGLIGVDAAHIQWHPHGGPDEVPNGLALCVVIDRKPSTSRAARHRCRRRFHQAAADTTGLAISGGSGVNIVKIEFVRPTREGAIQVFRRASRTGSNLIDSVAVMGRQLAKAAA
jgi:hypothetical protein